MDPQGHIDDDDILAILERFEKERGADFDKGPPMYIVSPNDRRIDSEDDDQPQKHGNVKTESGWNPTFTRDSPEWVTLSRASALARRSFSYLMGCLTDEKVNSVMDWKGIFLEVSASFRSYSALLRVDNDFVVDSDCSSTGSWEIVTRSADGKAVAAFTRSMRSRYLGPKALRLKLYRNMIDGNSVLVRVFSTPCAAIDSKLTRLLLLAFAARLDTG